MNKNILMMVDVVSNEKGVDKEIIFQALEAALASATKKKHSEEYDVRVAIERATGDYETFRRWTVMADGDELFESPERHIYLADAQKKDPNLQVGSVIEEKLFQQRVGGYRVELALLPGVYHAEAWLAGGPHAEAELVVTAGASSEPLVLDLR